MLAELVLRGGYPEAGAARPGPGGGPTPNRNQLAGQVGLDNKTAAKYLGVFEQLFLLGRILPWGSNRLSRIVITPKLQFLDSGLLAILLGYTIVNPQLERSHFGPLLENYGVRELLKLASWSSGDLQVLGYRARDQLEVDVVLENNAG